jgi:hypothetical protein
MLAALFLLAPSALPAQAQDVPSYAHPQYADEDQVIHGRILGFDGGYALSVRDERGFVDEVRLHDGTIINPTGLSLRPGMIVNIIGYNTGPFLAANEIDTPYTYYSGVPYYEGHPWDYYGPSIRLSFFFGNPGWWHANYFGGDYRFAGGARVYNNVHVVNVYHGGELRGRDYVAGREHGGYHAGEREARETRDARGDRGDHGDRGDRGDHGDRGDRGHGHEH